MESPPAIPVHPGNVDQLRAWDGDDGAYWAAHADSFERSMAGYDGVLLDAAAVRPGDRVLDVGCGTGSTTRAAARRAAGGAAVGIDLSSAMIAVARDRAAREGLATVTFLQADAQIHAFEPASFDVVVSRAAAMFFADPVAAFTNLRRALRPEGRLAVLVWQPASRNDWFAEVFTALSGGRELPAPPPDVPSPFAFADPARLRAVLSAAGFPEPTITGVEQPMWLGPDAAHAHALMGGLLGWLVDGLDDAARARALEDLRRTMAAHEGADGVQLGSACWLATTGVGSRRPG